MADISNITRDFVLGTDGVTYFEILTVDYDNEEQKITKTAIGAAAILEKRYADNFEQIAATMANNADTISRARKTLNEINNDATQIQTITGADPLATIQARYESELLTPGWAIDEGAGFVPLTFTVNGQGNLRYSINGGSTKGATIYGGVLVLKNYPSSPTDTEFFITGNGNRFYSLPNRNVIIKKP